MEINFIYILSYIIRIKKTLILLEGVNENSNYPDEIFGKPI